MLTQADEYRGFHIPSGTLVFVNAWWVLLDCKGWRLYSSGLLFGYAIIRGILHDEELFPQPKEFKPERWISKDGHLDLEKYDSEGAVVNPWVVVFGYGRRICQGIVFSEYGLWIAMAIILSSLEIRPKVDKFSGKAITIEPTWTGETAR